MIRKAYIEPAYLTESFVQLEEEEQERLIWNKLEEGNDREVLRLFRELVAGNYKEEARLVDRVYNAYYPHKRIEV